MNKRIRNRSLIVIGITIVSIILFAGLPPSREGLKENIRLGLDLRGGTQLVLQVNVDDALKATTNQTIEALRAQMDKDGITVRQITPTASDTFEARGVDPAKDSLFRNMIEGAYADYEIISSQGEVPNTYTLKIKARAAEEYRLQAVDQALRTIENRVNSLGVAEPVIQKRGGPGEHEIIVQFPGIDDPEYVKRIIGKPALLELKLVQGFNSYPTRDAALQQFGGLLPENLEILESSKAEAGGSKVYWVVNKISGVTGRDLKSAGVSRDTNGRPAVSFNLNAAGAQKFGQLTGNNVGRLLAIVLDGQVVSAPELKDRITDTGIITGGGAGFSPEEARDLALVLKSGALPASMTTLQEAVVGASLGADSIRNGLIASVVALVSVIGFVLFYYKASGINAMIAMILNLVMLFAFMAVLGATLTLPGIAGVILTIGMGIDSNVLIFERIREELRAGKTAASSVTTSFSRVFVTLVDTHLAALISAAFLFLFGSGAVKGFAVTLVIGLISNMFTAVFVSRTLFEIVLSRKERAETLSI
ncbi:MAG TPA: protein translocase subunit SecD [Terriglobia bacterium]|nr:protein translocase subunit SecD [Terriglobia bacterium]